MDGLPMDSSSISKMAARLAGAPTPGSDPLSELEALVMECRQDISQVAAGVAEGRLSEECMTRLWGSLQEKARSACDGIRSCKSEIESVLPRSQVRALGPTEFAKADRSPT